MISLGALIEYHKAKMTTYRLNYCHVVRYRHTAKQSDRIAYQDLRKRDYRNYKLHRDAVKYLEYVRGIHGEQPRTIQ